MNVRVIDSPTGYKDAPDAEIIEIVPWLTTFIHYNGKGFGVIEYNSGSLIAIGDTKDEAIAKAMFLLVAVGEESVLSFLNKELKKGGRANPERK